MLATLTTKGQVTLPKKIREKLGLKAGSKLDFELLADDTVKLRRANRTALSIMGTMKRPRQRPVSIEEMYQGITSFLARRHGRSGDDAHRSGRASGSGHQSVVASWTCSGSTHCARPSLVVSHVKSK